MPIYKRIKELRKNVLKLTQEDFSKKLTYPVLIWEVLK